MEVGIRVALTGLLRLTARPTDAGTASPPGSTLEAAYTFGQFEARRGWTMDALLAAYRVGARVAWRDFAAEMVHLGVSADTLADLAELVFAYIDQLSAASVAGHADELASAGRAHQQHVQRLARQLLEGAPEVDLLVLAETAGWRPPESLTAVVLPAAQVRRALQRLDHRTLTVPADLATDAPEDSAVLLVPDVHRDRAAVLEALREHDAVVGPSRPWTAADASYQRALRALARVPFPAGEALDTDAHLVELIVGADRDTLEDLRARALSPLATLRPATAARLAETLRSWLLHQGRRDDVAADLNIHAQTVRYRMGQIRDLFDDQLVTPRGVLELVVALATFPTNDEPAGNAGRAE
jgi:hypothetical protein